MNADTWDTAVNALTMLDAVRDRVSPRKFRLFALACCRRREDLIQDYRCREALRLGERLAEEKVPQRELDYLRGYELPELMRGLMGPGSASPVNASDQTLAQALDVLLDDDASGYSVAYRVVGFLGRGRSSLRAQVGLLREVMGNPFRQVAIDPAWLAWERGLVRGLAQLAYDGRAFDRLPIIADALEDAGCNQLELLAHLRGGGPHVLGCWALDALMGKF